MKTPKTRNAWQEGEPGGDKPDGRSFAKIAELRLAMERAAGYVLRDADRKYLPQGVCQTVQESFDAARQAAREDLRGLYPSACIVLANELTEVYDMLRQIAYPRRGTEEEHASLYLFAERIQKRWPELRYGPGVEHNEK